MPRPKKDRSNRAATLADVGREAGVSTMAASTVLNGARTSSRISAETRQRILKAAARLNYRPNAAARALVRRSMNTLGVVAVVHDGGLEHYFLELLNGILESAAHRGQNITVFTIEDWQRDIDRIVGFCDGRVDGMILVAPIFDSEAAALLPKHTSFVSIHANQSYEHLTDIEANEEAGSLSAMRLLIELGHRRIMHLAGPSGLSGAERRLTAYRQALTEAGIPIDTDLVAEAGFSNSGGKSTMQTWLKSHREGTLPTAVFCSNDSVAAGCLEALAEAGVRVPDDISVIGFDDSLTARTTVPQLTTVRQPLRKMGNQAVETLLIRLQKSSESAAPDLFAAELIERGSTARCPEQPVQLSTVHGAT